MAWGNVTYSQKDMRGGERCMTNRRCNIERDVEGDGKGDSGPSLCLSRNFLMWSESSYCNDHGYAVWGWKWEPQRGMERM